MFFHSRARVSNQMKYATCIAACQHEREAEVFEMRRLGAYKPSQDGVTDA